MAHDSPVGSDLETFNEPGTVRLHDARTLRNGGCLVDIILSFLDIIQHNLVLKYALHSLSVV